MYDIELTKVEKVYAHIKMARGLTITHTGDADLSVDIFNFAIFVEDTETEKELVAQLFLKFEEIKTIEVLRFQQYSTVYERTTK